MSLATLIRYSLLAQTLLAPAVWAQVSVSPATRPGSKSAASRPETPAQRYSLGPAPQSTLGPIDDSVRDVPPPRQGLLRVAAHRPLTTAQLDLGLWQKTSSGQSVWRLNLRSTGAVGVRLHFVDFSVGGGQVWVHDTASPPKQVFGPYTGKGRNGDGDFWTEVVFSDTIQVEYQPASGSSTSGRPPFALSELSHVWQFGSVIAPRNAGPSSALRPEASAATPTNFRCYLDASCYADPTSANYIPAVADATRGTAYILFGDSSGSYQCSATLLNAPNASPLLLTAGHCINTQTQARSLVALFNAVDQSCQLPPFTVPSDAQLSLLPQSAGLQMLSFADQAFLDESSEEEVRNDLDYSLVLLQNFPAWSNTLLAGYNATAPVAGQQLVSVSAPQGLFLKAAFSTVLESIWNNGFDVDQTSEGRIDSGSSGSGMFNSAGQLLGLLSTGSAPCADPTRCPTLDSCDVRGQFVATYTSFSAIYPFIRNYLNQPLDSSGVSLPADPSVFSVSPIANMNGAGFGDATLTVKANSGVTQIEIHVGSPNGPLFYAGGPTGTATAQGWVSEGTVFYLQDVSSNQARTLANTIATATAHRSAATFTATPPFILFPDAFGNGSMTLNWNVPGAQFVEIHLNSPTGTLFTYQGGPTGWAYAGGFVTDGMTFFLCNVSSGPCSVQTTVATLTAHVVTDSQDQNTSGASSLVAFPNPVSPSSGSAFGQTTLYWRAPGASTTEIHLNSPAGPLFSIAGASGSATTGNWVTNGLTFYLQDVTGGRPGVTLARTAVTLAGSSQ